VLPVCHRHRPRIADAANLQRRSGLCRPIRSA